MTFGGITAAAAVGLWFGGGWWDVLLTFVLGGAIQYLGDYSNAIAFIRMFECIASFCVGLLTVVGAEKFPNQICYRACSIAAVINIVQGVSITMAVVELATKNMISGSVFVICAEFVLWLCVQFSLGRVACSIRYYFLSSLVFPLLLGRNLA